MSDEKKIIQQESDIPVFDSEAEEAEFWATHELGDELLSRMKKFDLSQTKTEEQPPE